MSRELVKPARFAVRLSAQHAHKLAQLSERAGNTSEAFRLLLDNVEIPPTEGQASNRGVMDSDPRRAAIAP